MPLAKHKLELPNGWERIHQYIYVLQPNTDEHGWQYRSEWCEAGIITENDEQWVRTNAPGLDVRRRLWMITVVKRDDVVCGSFFSKLLQRIDGLTLIGGCETSVVRRSREPSSDDYHGR
jgi:hypothetical protein